jgi:Tol biopolymer transport system component
MLSVKTAVEPHRQWYSPYVLGLALALIPITLFILLGMRHGGTATAPRVLHATQLTNSRLVIPNGSDDLDSALLTDGSRIYFSDVVQGHITVQQLAVTGGDPVTIPTPFENSVLFDLSSDGTELLVGSLNDVEADMQLWILKTTGGVVRRVGDIRAGAAGWSPDGKRIAFGKGNQLLITDRNGGDVRVVSELPCECSISWPRWSPDGRLLRFTWENYANQTSTLWEVSPDGGKPYPVLPDWINHHNRKGNWTRDGNFFVFDDYANVWARSEQKGLLHHRDSAPVQLSDGALAMYSGVISPQGRKFFAVGERSQGEVLRYETRSASFIRFLDGLSAEGIDFSHDGQWMAYVAYPEGTLWRSRVDGTERLQLTSPPLRAVCPLWSPDGSRIAFTGQLAGKPVNVYTVNEDGRDLQPLPGSEWRIAPSWSPDGKSLVFAVTAEKRDLTVYDLEARTSRVLSPGIVYSPIWSPDGHAILAATPGPPRLRLFDLGTGQWTDLKIGSPFPDAWAWSRDGRYIYLDFQPGKDPSIVRLRLADSRREKIADLRGVDRANGIFGKWFGLDPNDAPMVLRDLSSQQIYGFDWER